VQTNLTESGVENIISFDFSLHRKGDSQDPHSGVTKSMEVIPSSVYAMGYWCSNSPSRYSCSACTNVKYELQAFAYKEDEMVSSLISEIRIYDTETPLPPPIYLAHFPGEYVMSQEKSLKKLGIRGANLAISVSEPPPMEIRNDDGIALAALPMKLRLSGASVTNRGRLLELRVTSRLKLHSFFSSSEMSAHPTAKQAQGSPFMGTLCKYGKPYVRNLRIDSWKPGKSLASAVKDMTLWVPILENDKPPPTFFTAFLTRRYSVAIKIDVNSGWQKASYRLNIPLQIVYPEDPVRYDNLDIAVTENEQGRLPIYSR
jgi:hypothetical protein